MAAVPYLLANPNPHHQAGSPHWYEQRREPILAIVWHVTAGLEDLDLVGPDHSAEATARYAAETARQVSWHLGVDTDSHLRLLPDEAVAFHVADWNSVTVGVEVSKRDTDWRDTPPTAVERTLDQAAAAVRLTVWSHGIPPRRATKDELAAARADALAGRPYSPVGHLGHYELDPPPRRTDPGWVHGVGDTFPWDALLDRLTPKPPPTTHQEDPAMMVVYAQDRPTALFTGDRLISLRTNGEVDALRAAGVPVRPLSPEAFDLLDGIGKRATGGK